MEDIESPSLDSGSWLSTWWEKTREQSEKQRESYKKAQTQIQKSQKDEKKAKGDNDNLFVILERFIQNPYYEELIPLVTELLRLSVPSRYILTLIALFYPEATIYLLTAIGKHDDIKILLSMHREEDLVDFDESSLHPSIRTWMSTWVQAGQLFIVQDTMSTILKKKLLDLFQSNIALSDALSEGIYFFFTSRNLRVSKKTTQSYAVHITHEYIVALKKSIQWWEQDLLEDVSLDNHALFWLSNPGGQV